MGPIFWVVVVTEPLPAVFVVATRNVGFALKRDPAYLVRLLLVPMLDKRRRPCPVVLVDTKESAGLWDVAAVARTLNLALM
jgi:hypothetical protein